MLELGFRPAMGYTHGYYLNHVGYKEELKESLKNLPSPYYLNHVGYKAISLAFVFKCSMYYLNHVGYKGKLVKASLDFQRFVLSEPCGI